MITLSPREVPLAPAAVFARGAVARALAPRLAERPCVAVSSGDAIVAIGAELPWVEGATWLGHEHGLYLPTRLLVSPHPSLVARALGAPVALLEEEGRLVAIPLAAAQRPGEAEIAAFLAGGP